MGAPASQGALQSRVVFHLGFSLPVAARRAGPRCNIRSQGHVPMNRAGLSGVV